MTGKHPVSHEYTEESELQRQITMWRAAESIHRIADAMPVGVLILNEQRQAVFANEQFCQIIDAESTQEIIGLRPGNIFNCVNSDKEEGGCGSSLLCKHCGAMRAIISSLFGESDIEECYLHRKKGLTPLELRVKTTPIDLNGENFTIFAVEDIRVEKERDALMNTLQKMSETDELTGLHNRRYTYKEAERELNRADRYNNPVSCFLLDIDFFKQINDTYGHQVGDLVLVEFAKVLQHSLRKLDIITRWGGDEFLVLLPESDQDQALTAAERLRENTADMRVSIENGEISISISIGVTCLADERHISFTELIKEADEALYQAKHQGRNCAVLWRNNQH